MPTCTVRSVVVPSGTIRRVALICVVYLAVTAALVAWTRQRVTAQAWDMMEGTAKLISLQIALVMNDAIRGHQSGEINTERLRDTVELLTERSTTVRYATIVGADGHLIVSNDPEARARTHSPPRRLFGDDQKARIETRAASSLKRGEFHVQIPFVRSGKPIAYLHLNLVSTGIAGLYRSTHLSQLVLSTVGLVAIGSLALVLHLRHERSRRSHGRWLAAALEGGGSIEDLPDPFLTPGGQGAERLRTVLTEDELRAEETKRQLGQLDRALDVGFVITDPAGYPQIVGARARELLGVEPSHSIQREAANTLEDLSATVQTVVEKGAVRETMLNVHRPQHSRQLDIRVLPLETEEGRTALLQIRDRNQVRALQRSLLDAARLRGLTRLYLGVAHDLRAPLNAIALNLANLQHSLGEAADLPNQEEHCRTVELIEHELDRLQRSVEALLRQTEPINEEREEFDLRELVENLELLVGPQAHQQRLDLEVTVPREEVNVFAQKDWVHQGLLNLVVNAFDATAEGGRVTVEVKTDLEWNTVIVTDTGSGIPGEVVPYLFKMYTTTKSSGSGIGLFVARSAIEACGGTLDLARTGPDGTAFRIRLPRAEGRALGDEA
jgi:signal transduction histidine kinase